MNIADNDADFPNLHSIGTIPEVVRNATEEHPP